MGEAKAKKEAEKNEKKKSAVKKTKESAKTQKEGKTEAAARKAPVVKKDAVPTGKRLKKFLKGSVSELKKVHWPNKQQLVAFTGVVVVSVLIISALIWVVDSGLTQLIKLVLKK